MSENNNMNSTQWEDPTPRQKKRGKGPIVALVLLLAVIAGLGYAYAKGMFANFGLGGGNKNQQVASAISGVVVEGEDNKFVSDWVAPKEVAQNVMKGLHVEGNLELVDAPILQQQSSMPIPKGIGLSFVHDNTDKAASGKIAVSMMGTDALAGHYYGDESKIQFAAPALFNEVITADLTGDIVEKIKNSPLVKESGSNINFEELQQAVDAMKGSGSAAAMYGKVISGDFTLIKEYPALEGALNKFRDSWKVEDTDKKKMTYNGEEKEFKGYKTTISKDGLVKFLEELKTVITTDEKFKKDITSMFASTYAKEKGISVEEAYKQIGEEMQKGIDELMKSPDLKDIVFTTHLTDDNQMVAFNLPYTTSKGEAVINLERNGGDFPNQNAKFTVTSGESQFEILSEGKTEGDVQTRKITMGAKNGTTTMNPLVIDSSMNKATGEFKYLANLDSQQGKINAEVLGKLQDVVKGKSATQIFDSIKVSVNDQPMITLKGKFGYNTDKAEVKPLEGTPLDLFTATKADIDKITQQVQTNIQKLVMTFMMPTQQ